jgi:hypothetical protein
MSAFLNKEDYKYHLRTNRLDQILEAQDEDEDLILGDAEDDAISIIRDAISTKYDADQIFSQTGDARHRTILRWAKVLVIYFIYERIPDEMVPERVVKNYNDTLERLRLIEQGEVNLDGAPVLTVTDENGENSPKTRRRWGSIPKRSNDGGSPRFLNR